MDAPDDDKLHTLASRVAERLLGLGQRLVTAESCTGGWIGKACTDLPGSSRWFLGGAIVYANEAKAAVLGVDPSVLRAEGAVSEATVRAMAAGALERFGAEVSVAVSGVAGPDGGTPDKPVGTVWFAWAQRRGEGVVMTSALETFPGNREDVRRRTVERALRGLLGL
ncbi:MAG TPA: CinA family protein [Steroidobacteraceae bacterium]